MPCKSIIARGQAYFDESGVLAFTRSVAVEVAGPMCL
jgi:hypothetical protein